MLQCDYWRNIPEENERLVWVVHSELSSLPAVVKHTAAAVVRTDIITTTAAHLTPHHTSPREILAAAASPPAN